jgi:hypothetical protein
MSLVSSSPIDLSWRPPTGAVANWFETISVVAVIVAGIAFTVAGWDQFVGAGRVWVVLLLLIGVAAAAAIAPLRRTGHHALAGVAATISLVTPTGFAYLANMLMIVVVMVEFSRAWRGRTR